jgi:hypothetical protein
VHAYIIDKDVLGTHQQFAGRIGNGYTAVATLVAQKDRGLPADHEDDQTDARCEGSDRGCSRVRFSCSRSVPSTAARSGRTDTGPEVRFETVAAGRLLLRA